MKAKMFLSLARSGQGRLLMSLGILSTSYYRVCFVAAAHTHGLLAALSRGARTVDELAKELSLQPSLREGLFAWLQFGVRLRELRLGPEGYSLGGYLSKTLADPANDAAGAFLQELVDLEHRYLLEIPALLKEGRKFTLAEHDGRIVARSSRLFEPFVHEAIDEVLQSSGPVRLLEIGCGSGTYIRYAASKNPMLTAVGFELQPEVADLARRNLRDWNLSERARVETAGVQDCPPEPAFDLVTMHNNIYYFPSDARIAVLRNVRGFLKSGGCLLLTTGCQGRNIAFEFMNLWGVMTEGCGPLPGRSEMISQLEAAGYYAVRARKRMPGAAYYSFTASQR